MSFPELVTHQIEMEVNAMIDYIKLSLKVDDYKQFMRKFGGDLSLELNYDTGELCNPLKTSFRNIEIEGYNSGRILIKGSVHKFKNGGLFNFDDFYFSDLSKTIHDIFDRTGLPLKKFRLENLEVGLNIYTSVKARELLECILFHGRSFFNDVPIRNGKYLQVTKNEYFLKAYDKGVQQNKSLNLFRWEIKFRKMRMVRQKFGITNLEDLLNPIKLSAILEFLVLQWDKVVMADPTIRLDSLSIHERRKWDLWSNERFWKSKFKEAKKKDINKVSREIKMFQKVNIAFSDNLHASISRTLQAKSNQLLDG